MNENQVLQLLERDGLRIATEMESGWTWSYVNTHGQRVSLWVTEIGA